MEDIFEKIRKNKQNNIGVIGDSILDEYLHGESSDFEGMPVFTPGKRYMYLGGAANVALNVKKMIGDVRYFSVIGDSEKSRNFNSLMTSKRINDTNLLKDNSSDICYKKRLVADSKVIIRIDDDHINKLNENTAKRLINMIQYNCGEMKVLSLSNYYKGCISDDVFNDIKNICGKNDIKLIVDCGRLHDFNGVYLLKPNIYEFENMAGRPLENIDDITETAVKFRKENGIANLMITMNKEGAILIDEKNDCHRMESVRGDFADPCGAGDSMMAAIAMCLANDIDIKKAAELSAYAAAVCCGNLGTYAVSLKEIQKLWSDK